ncbi:MAG: tyrosine-type recombinase/integrase [Candidatus Buchananbacteria bacterium]|nr:tyrosine-type recombinase/integrase [Candidatus Buchananbacteria bacterium]
MKKSNKPLVALVPDYLDYCEVEKGLSPVSTRNYDNFLKVFKEWLKIADLSGLKPHELTPDHIWDYRLYLSRKTDPKGPKGHQMKKTTQSYYLRALRGLLNYCADKDIVALPAEKVKLPKLTDKDKTIKFLKFDQIEKLLQAPDSATPAGLRDRALLEILFSTGMRVSELTSLNVKQFNRNNLLAGKFTDQEIMINGKGGKTRTIYFSNRALQALARYLKTRGDLFPPLFINYRRSNDANDEHRLSTRAIEEMVKKYTVMAGLPVDATPHTLRHSYATDLLTQGADLRSVQELLGHSNIATTQIYTHVTNQQLKDVHKKFHSGK